jgi:flagellar biosynthesis protein FlhG
MSDDQGQPKGGRALRVIAVTSGKGGVGKTHLTVNLGITLAQQGRNVLIIDGDVGLANVDILLDEIPRYTLHHVLTGQQNIDDVLLTSQHGVTVLPGTSGIAELADLSPEERMRLLDAVDGLEERFDTVLIDTAAGIGSNATFFAGSAQEVLVVATPEPTSLADAYAMIKVLARRHSVDRIGLVLNQTTNEDEAMNVYERLSLLTSRFLSVVLELVGHIPADPHVPESVKAQQPVVTAYPSSPAAVAVKGLADAIVMRPVPQAASGRMQFFWRSLLQTPNANAENRAPGAV